MESDSVDLPDELLGFIVGLTRPSAAELCLFASLSKRHPHTLYLILMNSFIYEFFLFISAGGTGS